MKCIHEKCKYCTEHELSESYSVCSLLSRSFKKESDINCLADKKIALLEEILNGIKTYAEFIRSEQNE